jgi:ubiquinone/menaquinone biosynthesis C-methylase UbiE
MKKTIKEKKDIQSWWADKPMTYGETHGKTTYINGEQELGSREFFERVDQEFYSWNKPLHQQRPFDRIFPYDTYKNKKILEIGCGMGTMSSNWARNGGIVTAVDLNPVAIKQTTNRFKLFGLNGEIKQCDANILPIDDDSFDYAYSWGVLHHSPNLEESISEMMRVIKPGGSFGIMLYNRQSILHWYMTEYVEGFLHYEHQFLNALELASRYGDGAREEGNPHTWPVTKSEMRNLLKQYSPDLNIKVLGTDLDFAFRYLLPGLGLALPAWVKKPWARRFGWSLWMEGHKN